MTLTLAKHVSVTETDNGMVLLNQRSGRYWQLNNTAATVMRALLEGRPAEDAVRVLREQHSDPDTRIEADVDNFLQALRTAKLVTS
jgi:hypothetical protein